MLSSIRGSSAVVHTSSLGGLMLPEVIAVKEIWHA